jgi:hypothetical protein
MLPYDHEPPRDAGRWRRHFYLAMLLILFTALQLWAAVVALATIAPQGASQVALLFALGGAAIAVIGGWRCVLRMDRQLPGS